MFKTVLTLLVLTATFVQAQEGKPPESYEYKVLLAPAKLGKPKKVKESIEKIARAVQGTSTQSLRFAGHALKWKKAREVYFLDTPSFALYDRGYTLRVRGAPGKTKELTLKFRNRHNVDIDLQPPRNAKAKFEADRTPTRLTYSWSIGLEGLQHNALPRTLQAASWHFPVVQGVLAGFSSEGGLKATRDILVREERYQGFEVLGLPKGKGGFSLWYMGSQKAPLAAEFSFSHKGGPEADSEARSLFKAVLEEPALATRLAPEGAATKTRLIYGRPRLIDEVTGTDQVTLVRNGRTSDKRVASFKWTKDKAARSKAFHGMRPGQPPAESVPKAALGSLEIHVLNVGQADAVLVRCPHGTHELLLDSGGGFFCTTSDELFQAALARLQEEANPIEAVIATHPHTDHIGGMPWVFGQYRVEGYIDNGIVYSTKPSSTYQKVERAYKREKVDWYVNSLDVQGVQDFLFCPLVRSRLLIPQGFANNWPAGNINNCSVSVRLDYRNSSFLFTGDAEEHLEEQLLRDPRTRALLDVDFYKAGHHGARNASTPDFMKVVRPEVVAISCGIPEAHRHSSHRHPRKRTIDTLKRHTKEGASPHDLTYWDSAARRWVRGERTKEQVYATMGEKGLTFQSDGERVLLGK